MFKMALTVVISVLFTVLPQLAAAMTFGTPELRAEGKCAIVYAAIVVPVTPAIRPTACEVLFSGPGGGPELGYVESGVLDGSPFISCQFAGSWEGRGHVRAPDVYHIRFFFHHGEDADFVVDLRSVAGCSSDASSIQPAPPAVVPRPLDNILAGAQIQLDSLDRLLAGNSLTPADHARLAILREHVATVREQIQAEAANWNREYPDDK